MFRTITLAAAAALTLGTAALADIVIENPYARASGMGAIAGAAFMTIVNTGDEDDRLILATSDVAERVELHTHLIDANGVARMVEVEDGFAIPAGSSHSLQRGGDHVMFMGLRKPFEQDDIVTVQLTFEKAGEMTVEIPVDLTRAPTPGTGGGMMHDRSQGSGG